MQTLQNPAVIVAITLVAVLGGNWLREQWKKSQAEHAAREAIRNAVWEKLSHSIEELMSIIRITHEDAVAQLEARQQQVERASLYLKETKVAQEAFLAGTIRVGEAVSIAIDELRKTVKEFGKLVFGNDPGKEALQVPTDADKDRVYSLVQHRMAGHTEEEASALADLDEERAASAAYPTE